MTANEGDDRGEDESVEDLTLEFEPVPYGPHLHEPGRNGIFLERVHQFWIRDVEILDADSGIVSNGRSRFGTISGVRLVNDRRGGLDAAAPRRGELAEIFAPGGFPVEALI